MVVALAGRGWELLSPEIALASVLINRNIWDLHRRTHLQLGDGGVVQGRLADGDVVLLLVEHWRVVVLVPESHMNLFIARPETLRANNDAGKRQRKTNKTGSREFSDCKVNLEIHFVG